MGHVPYRTLNDVVHEDGQLVAKLTLQGDIAVQPESHVIDFIGQVPCNAQGQRYADLINGEGPFDLTDGLVTNFRFSAMPRTPYADYYAKMTTYVHLLSGPAERLDPTVTAQRYLPVVPDDDSSVFKYLDTASSNADIVLISKKLELAKLAIVGLGGTGAYILDQVAKTPVREIHLFDGDVFRTHNAFRSPGAATIEELREGLKKVDYYTARYAPLRNGLHPNDHDITAENIAELWDMDFVFLAIDGGTTKEAIVRALESHNIPFIDTGLGVEDVGGSLLGMLRVTTSTRTQRAHVWKKHRIRFGEDDRLKDYDRNIQIADLNALNAVLAVIRWKKLFGFYLDAESEHFTLYTTDGNTLFNEDQL
jgi:hypothetical protein